MIALNRIRIFLFAIMIFGAFASFARNAWGNTTIIWCQVAIAISFLLEMIVWIKRTMKQDNRKGVNRIELICGIVLLLAVTLLFAGDDNSFAECVSAGVLFAVLLFPFVFGLSESVHSLVKKQSKTNTAAVLESHFIFIGFLGAIFKNMFWPGASMLSVVGLCGLSIFYLVSGISFAIKRSKSGRTMALLLGFCSLSAALLGLAVIFLIQHWPLGEVLLYAGLLLTIIVLLISLKRKFTFDGASIGLARGLQTLKSHFLLVYIVSIVFCGYISLKRVGIAPDFYSQYYPAATYRLQSEHEKSEIKDLYEYFMKNSQANGFLK